MATDSERQQADADHQSKPRWLKYLHENYPPHQEGSPVPTAVGNRDFQFECILAAMVKEYLLCDDTNAPATFAKRFDGMYGSVYEPRYNGYNKRKGWTGFLLAFYHVVFGIARIVRYDDPKQDKIVQLVVELQKLPTRPAKIFVQTELEWVDGEIWGRDPLLPWNISDDELMAEPNLANYNLDIPEDMQAFESDTARWVDAHAFEARCTAAGFDEGFSYRFTHSGVMIALGLEPGYSGRLETRLDCHIMAAAQYILIAGDVVNAECVKKQLPTGRRNESWDGWRDGNGPVVWKQWGKQLIRIADALESGKEPGFKIMDEKNREALKDSVIKARDKMIALEPELFAQPDSEPEPEPGPAPVEKQAPETCPAPSPDSGTIETCKPRSGEAEASSQPHGLRAMLERLVRKVRP